jgi:uncharacterized protein GlcG (DUF336 family)
VSPDPDFSRWRPGQMPYAGSDQLRAEVALNMIHAGVSEANNLDVAMTICVVDVGAQLMSLHRMSDAMAFSVDLAYGKAQTAVRTKQPTHVWQRWFRDGGPTHGVLFPPGFVSVAGGFPLVRDNVVVGGLGVSGAQWEDLAVAAACISAGGFSDADVAPVLARARSRVGHEQ